jgi:hypothetical protein
MKTVKIYALLALMMIAGGGEKKFVIQNRN